MFARRAIFKQSCSELLVAWVLRLSLAVACAYPFPAFSGPVPVWATFTPEDSDLPHTDILALAFGEDGALWMGTHGGGLARFDKDGRWKTYTTANPSGGPPYRRTGARPAESVFLVQNRRLRRARTARS
jgi:hypothetical protein